MRYLMQLLIPALIVIGVIYVVLRSRQNRSDGADGNVREDGDKGMFIAILLIGALVAVAVIFALQGFWSTGL